MLLSDPRGSVNAAVNLVIPPIAPEADVGMIVVESDYYPPCKNPSAGDGLPAFSRTCTEEVDKIRPKAARLD